MVHRVQGIPPEWSLLSRLDNPLENLDMDLIKAPIISDGKWESFVDSLHEFSGNQRDEASEANGGRG